MLVIDSSVVLGLIRREPGIERHAHRISGATISAVNYSEVLTRLIDLGIADAGSRAGLDALDLRIAPFDRELSERASHLRDATRRFGISLGDRACLALALSLNLPVLTNDRIWLELDIGIDIELAR